MNLIVNGLVTQYNLSGKGQLVLLLHGWGDDIRGLRHLNAQLSKQYRVIALDLPGFGGTNPPKAIWDLDEYAKFVADFLAKLNLDQPYAIIGHSNGGALAIRGCALQLFRPQKLILIAASGIRNSRSVRRLIFSTIAKIGSAATFWLPHRHREALRQHLYGAIGSDLLVVAQLQDTFKKTVRQDVQADAAKLELPTLLLYAENDEAVPLADGQRYHSLIRSSRLEIIKNAGHFVHLDQTDQVEHFIEKFLEL